MGGRSCVPAFLRSCVPAFLRSCVPDSSTFMVVMSFGRINPKGRPSLDPQSPPAVTPLALLAFTMIQPSASGLEFVLIPAPPPQQGKGCGRRVPVTKQCMGGGSNQSAWQHPKPMGRHWQRFQSGPVRRRFGEPLGQDSSPDEDNSGQEDGRAEDGGAAVLTGCKTPPVLNRREKSVSIS